MADRNNSSQMKAALQQDDDMQNRDQAVKRHPNGEVLAGNLVDIDKTLVTKSLHRDSERERDGEREKEGEGKAGGGGDANGGRDRERKRDTEGARGEKEKRSCCSQKLEQLSFSRTHNVLIDVRERIKPVQINKKACI